jgi:hypothetical protein
VGGAAEKRIAVRRGHLIALALRDPSLDWPVTAFGTRLSVMRFKEVV